MAKSSCRVFLLLPMAFFLQGAVSAISVDVSKDVTVVVENQDVSVLCMSGQPLQYCRIEQVDTKSWHLKPGPPTPDGVSYWGHGLDSGECGISVRRVQTRFNGQYKCTMGFANAGYEEGVGTFNITVAVAPSTPRLVVKNRDSSNINKGSTSSYSSYRGRDDRNNEDFHDGENLVATCTVSDGRPAANISWFLDDQELNRGLQNSVITHKPSQDLYSIEQNLTYQVSWRDHGKKIRCVAGHVALEGQENQTSHTLNVRFSPRPHSDTIDQFGFVVGQAGEIPMEIKANPEPSISWIIDNKAVPLNGEDASGHFQALSLMNNGSGVWTALLRITDVTMQDIEREYVLHAENTEGKETYRIHLSTSSEPSVMPLEAGAIIGIVAAILVLLLAIFLLIFARTTGRWCFAGGVSKQDPKESSDTESADHGSSQSMKSPKSKISNIFKKKGDKVGDDTLISKEVESPMPQTVHQQQPPLKNITPDTIVYAELDLKDIGERRPQVRPDEERTEYAEILYTAKPIDKLGPTSPPQP